MSFWSSLFGSKTTVSVASTVYNLAGNESTRPNYLKTTIFNAIMSPPNDKLDSLGAQITNSYLNGPAIQLRGFARWAQNYGYSALVGQSASNLYIYSTIDPVVLAAALPAVSGQTLTVQNASVGPADFVFWVMQYMQINYPTQVDTAYTCDYNSSDNVITINLIDGSVVTFVPAGFNTNAQYLYVEYNYTIPAVPAVGSTPAVPAVVYPPIYYAYQQNSGNAALDVFFNPTITSDDYYFPYIPLRINNTFISTSFAPDVYAMAVKAVKKSLGTSFDTIIANLNTNASIGKIQYAYIVFGVSINVLENTCRVYMYNFFANILHNNPGATYISIVSSNLALMHYEMAIYWSYMTETVGSGTLTNASGNQASAGDVWWTVVEVNPSTLTSIVRLYYQISATSWKYLEFGNLYHANLVYGNNAVITYAPTALETPDESGFIIPLNQAVFNSTPLIDATQMATACCFIICNSYTIDKEPWYDTNFFKVLLIVAVIVLAALTANPASLGLLGTNLAVGTALGLTAGSAVIIGAVVNSLAAVILVQLVQVGAKDILGAQYGAIVGAIAGLVLLQVGTALQAGVSASSLLNTVLQPINLLKLTEAAGNGYAQFMELGAQKINQSTTEMLASYSAADDTLKAQEEATFGTGGQVDLALNPLSLIDTALPNVTQKVIAESPGDFFTRTLMSGSDIAALSLDYVTNFCDATLSVKLNKT